MSKNIAVVLSGCGAFDGSEVHEASAVCEAITRAGHNPVFYAPNKPLYQEVNHASGDTTDSTSRNALIESARIARGSVRSLSSLNVNTAEAIIFPGGFGAVKNLCTFAVSQTPEVDDEVERVLRQFHESRKVIGMCCISPIIAALVFGRQMGIPVKLTLGNKGENWPYADVIEKAREYGAIPVEMSVDGICIDEDNNLVSTPAFMFDGPFHKVHDSVVKMVEKVIQRM